MNRHQVLESMNVNHPAGAKLVEVSAEELARVYGGGDVQAETTPVCAAAIISSNACLYGAGVVIGVGLSIWKC